jgi:hypothetical protein
MMNDDKKLNSGFWHYCTRPDNKTTWNLMELPTVIEKAKSSISVVPVFFFFLLRHVHEFLN